MNQDTILSAMRECHDRLQLVAQSPLWAERSANQQLDAERSPLVALARSISALAEAIDTLRDGRDVLPDQTDSGDGTGADGEDAGEHNRPEHDGEPPRGRFISHDEAMTQGPQQRQP